LGADGLDLPFVDDVRDLMYFSIPYHSRAHSIKLGTHETECFSEAFLW
jgi:hypothetical protein